MHSRVLTLGSEDLSRGLYLLDPMRTCCVENECFDEYDRVADCIVQRIHQGDSLRDALHKEFTHWFGIDLPESAMTELTEHFQGRDVDESGT